MASEDEVFDTQAARTLVSQLRGTFSTCKTKSYEWRISQLKSLLKLANDHEQDIIDALRSDLAKPPLEAYVSEIAMFKSSCEFTIKDLKRWMMPEKVKTSITTFPSSAEVFPEPLGVVLVISAWNYPFLLSLDPVIGAIAAGNAVVLKPSEISPATSSLLAKLVGEYMDSSAVKVVEGAVPETSALLEQKWDKIFYTGNGKVGRIVLAAAAKHLTPVVLELGGKCPVFVDSNTNLKVTTRRIIAGKWGLNNGQACVSADHIITTKDFAPKLIDALKVELEKFYGNDPLKSEDLSCIVSSNHFARLEKLLDDDKISGKIVHGGQRDQNHLKISPTILLDAPEDSLIMNEEIFGPLLPIVTVDSLEDSFDMVNSKEKPLAAYLFTNDKKLKEEFVRNVSAGGLLINDIALHLANPYLPFGGVGESGMGAYHGKFSFDTFTHKKAVLYRSFAGDASARMANRGGAGRYGGSSRPAPNRRTYPPLSAEERFQLSQPESSDRWIDPMFHPLAAEYQNLFQRYEDRLIYDSGISTEEFAEIQIQLSQTEDDAIQQARTAIQQLVKIQQLKLEAFARTTNDEQATYYSEQPIQRYRNQLAEIHQQNCELKEIDNELFDVVMLMRHYRF